MSSSMIERHEVRIKFLLGLLEKTPDGIRRKDLKKQWLIKGFSETTFNSIFDRFLRKRGYIVKIKPDYAVSPYVITEAGKRYLAGLRA